MSSSQNVSAPPLTNFLPPPGTNFLAVIDGCIPFLMIGATMGAALFVMLLALVFFSTPSMKRTPLFVLNVISILCGISAAVVNIYEEIRTLRFPLVPLNTRVVITMGVLDGVTPLFVDSILLLRVYSVFPRTPSRFNLKLTIIMGASILVKIARLINASYFMAKYSQNVHSLDKTSTAVGGAMVLVTSPLPSVKIEWFLRMFDNIYSSTIFLYRFYSQSAPSRRSRERTISQKITTLFWISTSNFVFPVILSIVQLAIYMANPNNYLVALYVETVNYHFTIMGVVFATVWAAEGRWEDDNHINKPLNDVLSSIRFNKGSQEKNVTSFNHDLASSHETSTSQSMLEISVDKDEECGNEKKHGFVSGMPRSGPAAP